MPRKKKKDFFKTIDLSKFESATPSCPHFGECGGCQFQNITYDSQIQLKKEYLKSVFGEDIDVTPANYQLGYRNRMDFVYAFDKLGLRKKGDFKTVIALDECYMFPSFGLDVFKTIKSLLKSYSINSYDFIEHNGFLRYVTLRFAPSTQETMAIFTSASPKNDDEEKFLALLNELSSKDDLNVTSIYWFINDTLTDIAVPNVEPKTIIGKENLIETVGNTSLLFSPHSFFQVNSNMTEIVFNKIKEFTKGNIVDLCCGVGSISLFVRDKANQLLGIEEVSQAIDLAKENAELNDATNSNFFAMPMKKILDVAPMEVDTLIVDPPRAGLEKKVVAKILELSPDRIIYMSCNPKTQKMDLDMLTENEEYEVIFLNGYDMFPQTTHVEMLTVLDKII